MSQQPNQPSEPRDHRDARIAALETQVQELKLQFSMQFGTDKVAGAMVTLLTTMSEDLKDVKTALFGEPGEESVGLLVRLDRIEQWTSGAKWVLGVVVVEGVGILGWLLVHH